MVSWWSALRLRPVAVAVSAALLLAGCAAGGYDPNLSPAENQLRQSNARFNQTVGEGAGAGAILGAVAGLALGGRNRGQAALIGAAAGGALGAGAGYAVASNNLNRASSEAQFNDAIQQARADSEAYRSSALLSRQVADEALTDARRLNGQLRAGQITQAQYRSALSKYQTDSDAMTKQITEARKASSLMRQNAAVASRANNGALSQSAADVEASSSQIEQSQVRISRMLAGASS